jgi:ubiquinone/menaquinone biosynthesis C-methylase UbiE
MTAKSHSKIRQSERAKYNKEYFENFYWAEDFPRRKHYKKFNYNDPTHEKRFTFLSCLLMKYFDFHTFLDAGCGMGHIVRKLLTEGYDCKGTEASKYALEHYLSDLRKRGIVYRAGLENLPFKDSEFDLVFCSDVMEHIPFFDIEASIRELIRVTKKYLLLSINLDHPYEYHPTILSRNTWESLFLKGKELKQLKSLTKKIQNDCQRKYKEYEFFLFKKVS